MKHFTHGVSRRVIRGWIYVQIFILVFQVFAAGKSLSEKITDSLNQKDWKTAEQDLRIYISQNPDKAWAYSSHAWALENLRQYDEAIKTARFGLKKWPADKNIGAALARVLLKKAESLAVDKAHPLFAEAAQVDPREFTEFSLARSWRNLGNFSEAIRLMEQGLRKYPDSKRFADVLPYTRYLHFKEARAAKADLKPHIEVAVQNLLAGEYDQYYPRLILRFGLRDAGDRAYFQTIYDRLFAHFPENAWLHDDYGFQLYANYRTAEKSVIELRNTAISWRRKGYDLYWKSHALPRPVRNLAAPLRGRNIIWSEFGGTAMTHNGFSHYCYDFAAVDAKKNIAKPGSTRKRIEDYFMFGKPVFAVEAGEVTGIIDGFADNPPGGFGAEANTITLRHSGFTSFYAHMKNGGIKVKERQRVKRGDLIGYAGNSGMSSEPHLHFCIQADSTDDISIPFEFAPVKVETQDGLSLKPKGIFKEGEIAIFAEN